MGMLPRCAACGRYLVDLAALRIKFSKCGRHVSFYCEHHPFTPEPTDELADKLTEAIQWELSKLEYEQQEEDGANRLEAEPLRGVDLLRMMVNRNRPHN